MKLYRLDATHAVGPDPGDELVGQVTLFAATAGYLEVLKRRLADAGWEFDCYDEEVELDHNQMVRLVDSPWPTLSTAALVTLAADPKVAARDRLQELIATKQARKEGGA